MHRKPYRSWLLNKISISSRKQEIRIKTRTLFPFHHKSRFKCEETQVVVVVVLRVKRSQLTRQEGGDWTGELRWEAVGCIADSSVVDHRMQDRQVLGLSPSRSLFSLLGQVSVLALISVSVLPTCYRGNM